MLSDTHFSKDNQLLFNRYDAEKRFILISKQVQAENPDFIFVTGDISQDGTIESYEKAKDFFSKFGCPTYIIMGNHDTCKIEHMLGNNIFMNDHLIVDNNVFIFLSSFKGVGFNEGYINTTELEKINTYAQTNKNNFLIIHHHFIKNDSIMDDVILENHAEFCYDLNKINIDAIFHGHVHHGYHYKVNSIDIYANPSTCVQFAINKLLILENIIGFRVLTLNGDYYESHVNHTKFDE